MLVVLLFFAISDPQTIDGRFVRAVSGDTLLVETTDGRQLQVKLSQVAAPPSRTPQGGKAREFLDNLIKDSRDPTFKFDLLIEVLQRGSDERVVGTVQVVIGHSFPELHKAVGDDIRLDLLRSGWVKTTGEVSSELTNAMNSAQTAGLGIWARGVFSCPPSSCHFWRRRGLRRVFSRRR